MGQGKKNDPLTLEMKEYERSFTQRVCDPYLVVRVDGRGFSNYCRALTKPFDAAFIDAMDVTALALFSEIGASVVGLVQSDEISIIAGGARSEAYEHWFGGSVQKVASSAASLASVVFSSQNVRPGVLATFDGRAFGLPDEAAVFRYLRWRQRDAATNAVSMAAEHLFGSKALRGVSVRTRREMLLDAGYSLQDVLAQWGRFLWKESREGTVSYTRKDTGVTETVDVVKTVDVLGAGDLVESVYSDPVLALQKLSTTGSAR